MTRRIQRTIPVKSPMAYMPFAETPDGLLVYERSTAEQACLVALNLGGQPQQVSLDALAQPAQVTWSTRNHVLGGVIIIPRSFSPAGPFFSLS